MSKLREIKLNYQNSCKKFLLPENYESLISLVISSFNLNKELINFNYLDEEGDKIIISNQFDYEQVIKLFEKNIYDNLSNSLIKINIEKIHTKSHDTINSPNSPITHSLIMSNSQIEDDLTQNNLNVNYSNNYDDITKKIKNLIKLEVDSKLNKFKNKLISGIENKINNLFTNANEKTLTLTKLK